jgi:hypothetical protein
MVPEYADVMTSLNSPSKLTVIVVVPSPVYSMAAIICLPTD